MMSWPTRQPAPQSVIAARQALAAAIRDARRRGPITTRYYCEDCIEDHEETHYAPVADAVWQCLPLIDAVAWDRRNGVPVGGRGEQLLELAGTAYSGLGLTDEERTAQMRQALDGIAAALEHAARGDLTRAIEMLRSGASVV